MTLPIIPDSGGACGGGSGGGSGGGPFVRLQSTFPGTADSGNANVSGQFRAGEGIEGRTTLGLTHAAFFNSDATNANSTLFVRCNLPDTGIIAQFADHTATPVVQINESGTAGDTLHVVAKCNPASVSPATHYTLNINNDTATGDDLAMNTFYLASLVNVGTHNLDPNQNAIYAGFMYGYGTADLFGMDLHPILQPTADAGAGPHNYIGILTGLAWNRKTANTGAGKGLVMAQASTGAPMTAGGFNWGIQIERDRDLDYTDGTVSGIAGTHQLIGSGTAWLHAGDPPYYAFDKKKILVGGIGGNVYTIDHVLSSTEIILTSVLLTSPANSAYRIRVAEKWDRELFISDSGFEAIRVAQDPYFPPPPSNFAFVVTNPGGNTEDFSVDYAGTVKVGNAGTGGVITQEAGHVPPWVQPQVACSGATVINSTTPVDITGCTVTFRPSVDCRAMIVGVFDVTDTTPSGTSTFVGTLMVNGVAEVASCIHLAVFASVQRGTFSQVWTPALTGGVTYTFKLQGNLDSGAATYTVNQFHTTLNILGIGRF